MPDFTPDCRRITGGGRRLFSGRYGASRLWMTTCRAWSVVGRWICDAIVLTRGQRTWRRYHDPFNSICRPSCRRPKSTDPVAFAGRGRLQWRIIVLLCPALWRPSVEVFPLSIETHHVTDTDHGHALGRMPRAVAGTRSTAPCTPRNDDIQSLLVHCLVGNYPNSYGGGICVFRYRGSGRQQKGIADRNSRFDRPRERRSRFTPHSAWSTFQADKILHLSSTINTLLSHPIPSHHLRRTPTIPHYVSLSS